MGTHLSVLMIDHNVMRLHISVHDALAVTEVQGLEEFVDVESDVEVREFGVQASEVGVVDVFENQGWSLTLGQRARSAQARDEGGEGRRRLT